MGILALVLYVLGAAPVFAMLVEGNPKAAKVDLIIVSAFWPLISLVGLIRGLYEKVIKK
jgi:hypothetical protein